MRPTRAVFRPGQDEDVAKWIRHRNRKRNLYFSVNLPTREWLDDPDDTKASKHQIAEVRYLHVDLDPDPVQGTPDEKRARHEQERRGLRDLLTDSLPDGVPEPTAIVDSGGGFWGFWRLKEPIQLDGSEAQADDEALYSKRLQELFGADADSCHNVDRIARLPGTDQLPGREEAH